MIKLYMIKYTNIKYTNIKSVAFDFDGVIHKNVDMPDRYGQRHPNIPFNRIPHTRFDKIIDIIKIYYKHDYNIYIITARTSHSRNIVRQTLNNFDINENIISNDNLIFTGDIGGDKVSILNALNINDFYDDSPKIFKSYILLLFYSLI
jgi:hypothetical protein